MAFLTWRNEYKTGLLEIDAEHHHLFNLVNEFYEAQTGDDRLETSPAMLARVVGHAAEHFRNEEKLMDEIGYPSLEGHRKLHVELVSSISAITEWIENDPDAVNAAVLGFLERWLVDHIVEHDMDIGKFLRRKRSQAGNQLQGETAQTC